MPRERDCEAASLAAREPCSADSLCRSSLCCLARHAPQWPLRNSTTRTPEPRGASLAKPKPTSGSSASSSPGLAGRASTCTAPRRFPSDWPEQQAKIVGEEVTPNVRSHSYRTIDGLKQLVFAVPQLAVGRESDLPDHARSHPQRAARADRSGQPGDRQGDSQGRAQVSGPEPARSKAATPRFAHRPRRFVLGKEKAWEQVEAIYDGTRSLVQFDVDHKDKFKGAIGAIRDGKADKEDLNATFVALCRANKVPARMVWSMDSCYAEFFLADAAGKGMWFPCQFHNDRQFGSIRDFRPILEKGDNFRVPEKAEALRFVAEFLTGKGGGGRPQVEFRRRRLE